MNYTNVHLIICPTVVPVHIHTCTRMYVNNEINNA